MGETTTPRLMAAAKEFNIGKETLVDFLVSKGFSRDDLKPIARLTEEMYRALQLGFQGDKLVKQKSNLIDLPKGLQPEAKKKKEEEEITFIKGPKILGKIDLPKPGLLYAINLVQKCLTTKEQYLDIGNCDLVDDDFKEDGDLDQMLRQCSHLRTLILSNEWWVWEGRTVWWKIKYSSNKFKKNFLSKIPRAILSLKKLSKFICCGEMANSWQIIDIAEISELTELTLLDLRDNNIENLDSLKKLHRLRALYINRNQINSLKGIENLTSLTHLDIHSNNIKEIADLKNLTSLKILDIHNNKIKEIEGIMLLNDLREIYLSSNKIEELSGLEFLLNRSVYIEIDDNPVVRINNFQLFRRENHYQFIKEILRRQSDTSIKQKLVYPVKILLLGNHASGKSSLVNYLTGLQSEGSTHILRIENYFIKKNEFNKILPDGIMFDFGGQDFYHGLYQAFMSRDAILILLYEFKKDKNEIDRDVDNIPIINFNRRYWLGQKRYIETNGQEFDPYIVVQTHADDNSEETAWMDYRSFKGHKTDFFLSLKRNLEPNDAESEELYEAGRKYFKAYLDNLIHQQAKKTEEPLWYFQFLNFIIEKTETSHLPTNLDQIIKKYRAKDLSDEDKIKSVKTNLTILHRYGLVLYYENIPELENIVWLNPQKLVEFIQGNILNKDILSIYANEYPGVIPKSTFDKVVNDNKILTLLREQKVIFLHDPTNDPIDLEYIIPNYLPLFDNNSTDAQLLTFGFKHPDFVIKFNDFIPFGFVNQMICFFGKQPDVKRFWRNKLLFTIQNEARVMIGVDFEKLQININYQIINNAVSNSNDLNEYLYFSILSLYWNFTNDEIVSYKEFLLLNSQIDNKQDIDVNRKHDNWITIKNDQAFIPDDIYISLDSERFISAVELFYLNENEYKIPSYAIRENEVNFENPILIPANPFTAFTPKKILKMKKIFVSYSKSDEDYLDEFEDHLVTLKNEGIVTFNCRKIDLGKEWDEEIKKQIDECDIMVCLISVKFLNTDYITKIEVRKAIDNNKIIVPIIIKACDWENSELGKFQAAKRGKIVSLNNDLNLNGQIKAYTPEERAAFWTSIIKEFRTKLLLP